MRSVVVGVGGDERDAHVLDLALELAASRGLPVDVVHAVPPRLGVLQEGLRDRVQQEVANAVDRAAQPVTARWRVVESEAADALLTAAESAALLVVGRGSGWPAPLGAVSASCLQRSRAPVIVVPCVAVPDARRRVVVGLDGSAASVSALGWAVLRAGQAGWPLRVVTARAGGDSLECLQRLSADPGRAVWRLLAEAGGGRVPTQVAVLDGAPAQVLIQDVTPADLLVVGARARPSLLGMLLGSTTAQVAGRAPCPVAVVRAGQARLDLRVAGQVPTGGPVRSGT